MGFEKNLKRTDEKRKTREEKVKKIRAVGLGFMRVGCAMIIVIGMTIIIAVIIFAMI